MYGVQARLSGLPMNLWISQRGHAQHAAQERRPTVAEIEVQANRREELSLDHLAVVTVEDDTPQIVEGRLSEADLDLVRRYIALNKAAILDYWQGRTDGIEVARALRPLRGPRPGGQSG